MFPEAPHDAISGFEVWRFYHCCCRLWPSWDCIFSFWCNAGQWVDQYACHLHLSVHGVLCAVPLSWVDLDSLFAELFFIKEKADFIDYWIIAWILPALFYLSYRNSKIGSNGGCTTSYNPIPTDDSHYNVWILMIHNLLLSLEPGVCKALSGLLKLPKNRFFYVSEFQLVLLWFTPLL